MNLNWARKELTLKLVYYGPGLGGKTTNLLFVHSQLSPDQKTRLTSVKTREDRTIFFDFMQMNLGKVGPFTPFFNLYTVPGQDVYQISRKLILQDADGVVFVSDSSPQRMRANMESLKEMYHYLKELGIGLKGFPLIIQYNKRDIKNVVPLEVMEKYLNPLKMPSFTSVAPRGDGVMETLKALMSQTMRSAFNKLKLGAGDAHGQIRRSQPA